jgi:hypothetical protein
VSPEGSKDVFATDIKINKVPQIEVVPTRDPSSQASKSPVKILKLESAFAKAFPTQPSPGTDKKLSFADEHGDPIAENVYVESLHYSTAPYNTTEISKGCCIIS